MGGGQRAGFFRLSVEGGQQWVTQSDLYDFRVIWW
jgi:hypothetical protein